MESFSHEEPILVVLPANEPAATALGKVVADPEVRHVQLPPLWRFDAAGIDLPAALPDCRAITEQNLQKVLTVLLRLCTPEHLDELVAREWSLADERVRQHYLRLGIGQTFAAIFRVAPRTVERAPPPLFRYDRVHEHAFEVQYRLARLEDPADFRAPDEEGSIVLYPFDPVNAGAREEAGIGQEGGVVLEAFAYEPARARHRAFLERVAAGHGWRVVDPRLSG